MCTYNITVSDTLIERARPAIGTDIEISQWMQRELEKLLIRLSSEPKREDVVLKERYTDDLETILAMPLLDAVEVGLNGESARMDYLREKYAL